MFQICMISIFSDMLEETIKVFMDDFLVVGNSFDNYLVHLENDLTNHEEYDFVLNWEKCDFMVK